MGSALSGPLTDRPEADLIGCGNLSGSRASEHRALTSFQEFYRPVHGYVCVLLCVFGVVANTANIAVLTRKVMLASSINVILLAVAVADLLTMLLYFFQVLHFTLLSPGESLSMPHTLSYPWIVYSLFAISLVLVLHTVACWLTVALAVFRYLYIALPTRGVQMASFRNAYISIAAICLVFALTTTPNYLVNAAKACRSGRDDSTVVYLISLPDGVNTALVESNYWTIAILYKIVPCLMLSLMTVLLIVQLSKAARRRRKLLSSGKSSRREQRKDRREQRTTIMLLAIVIIFIITELPQGVMSLLCFVVESFETNVYSPLGDVLDLLSLVNNSVNFVLYTTMSKQFRDTFADVFLAWCRRSEADAAAVAAGKGSAVKNAADDDEEDAQLPAGNGQEAGGELSMAANPRQEIAAEEIQQQQPPRRSYLV